MNEVIKKQAMLENRTKMTKWEMCICTGLMKTGFTGQRGKYIMTKK